LAISASFCAIFYVSVFLLPFSLHRTAPRFFVCLSTCICKTSRGLKGVCVCVQSWQIQICCSGALLPWPVGTGIPLAALLVVSVLAVRCCSVSPLQLSRQGPQGACHCHCSANCLPLFRATVPFTVACHCSVFLTCQPFCLCLAPVSKGFSCYTAAECPHYVT
jgi:hypothetical protein